MDCGQKRKGLVVRSEDIQAFAIIFASQSNISLEKFKASQRRIDSFLLRYKQSLRRSTTLSKLKNNKIKNDYLHLNFLLITLTFLNTNFLT